MLEIRHRRLVVHVAVAVVSLCTGAWAWNSSPLNLRDRIYPKHLYEVEAGRLYRSGQLAPNLVESTLADLGIDLIVDLTHDRGDSDPAQLAERRAAAKLGIERVSFPLGGHGTGKVESYVGAVEAISRAEREGRQVLVHCRAGDRRTGGVLAAYQLLVQGESPAQARLEMDRFHRGSGADSPLARYLDLHLGEIADGLVQAGVIERVPDPLPRLESL